MPATSIRDLVIKNDDLVIGTHGRSFWILDDITPLRQISSSLTGLPAILYKPQTTYRVRWSMYPDTPLPQEEPAGQNPPDGAIINYYLGSNATNVKLEIVNSKGIVIRTYASSDTLYKVPDNNVPSYWIRPQQIISGNAGAHRFTWDMHYQPLNVPAAYPISATFMNTVPDPSSPWVMPGMYTARLIVDNKTYNQLFTVKMDPRVKTSAKDVTLQHDLSLMCYNNIQKCMQALNTISISQNNKWADLEKDIKKLLSTFNSIQNILQDSDMPPTTQTIKAAKDAETGFVMMWAKWLALQK